MHLADNAMLNLVSSIRATVVLKICQLVCTRNTTMTGGLVDHQTPDCMGSKQEFTTLDACDTESASMIF